MVWAELEDVLFDEATNEAIRSALPDAAITFFEVVTYLGDGATLIVLATLLYWFGGESNQRKRALVIAIGVGALAVSAGLKGIFVRPRPEMAGGYGGYSFPSAHALGSAAFYGSLAAIAETGTRGKRYAVAGTIITLVALSRVVIGVHYLGDVLVGVTLGLLFVALVLRDDDPEPGFVFGLAGVITIVALVLGSTEYTTMTIGAAVGAFVAWAYVEPRSPNPRGAAIFVLAYVCLPPIILLRAATGVFEGFWFLEIVGYAIATAAVLLVPVVAERMNDWPQVEWLQQRLPFTGRTVDPEEIHLPRGE
ncbi:phosphatase PAP2 family protein [Natrialbaceae archaeon A-gly3]